MADGRQSAFSIRNDDGTWTAKRLEHHWAAPAAYALSPAVPHDVCVHWDTARNLWLHAWFVYRFYPVAEMHAYSTLEMALRLRLGAEGKRLRGLKKLMIKAT